MTEPTQPYGPPPGYGPPAGPAGYGQPGYGAPAGYGPPPAAGWGTPGGGPGPYGPTETEPKAIVAIVLAVLAWTPVVPFLGAIAALVLARYARRDIALSGGRKTGLGLVKAATVLSWVHLAFVALLFTVILLLIVAGAAIPFVA